MFLPPYEIDRIEIELPQGTDAAIKAKTKFGKVESDYPVYLNSEKPIKNAEGKIQVKAETDNDIIIRSG